MSTPGAPPPAPNGEDSSKRRFFSVRSRRSPQMSYCPGVAGERLLLAGHETARAARGAGLLRWGGGVAGDWIGPDGREVLGDEADGRVRGAVAAQYALVCVRRRRQGRDRVVLSRAVEGRCQVTRGRPPPVADVRHLRTEPAFEEAERGGEVECVR